MTSLRWLRTLVLLALACAPGVASASGLAVELWTDRGNDGVYQPGDVISIKSRLSEDAFLLVYEIDSEGGVHLLFPPPGREGPVQGGRTIELPDDDRNQLVVDDQTGQGFVVAIASRAPFDSLPWYLRPENPQAEGIGYVGQPDQEEGVTADGKIVGDPFVAMERIRRRVVASADDPESFATTYVSYYVHEQVRYPRYLCYDCHRPGQYAWWDGFDPYYTTCTAFDFHVNWSWYWGPRYWFGSVPYFVYVYRDGCPPAYRRPYGPGATWYSSWDGWHRWRDLWGADGLQRYKSAPPPNYIPPSVYREASRNGQPLRDLPPGMLAGGVTKPGSLREFVPVGRSARDGGAISPRAGDVSRQLRGAPSVYERRQFRQWEGGGRMNGTGTPRYLRGEGGFQRVPIGSPRLERAGGGFPRGPGTSAPRVERAPSQSSGGVRHEATRGGGVARTSGEGGGGARQRR